MMYQEHGMILGMERMGAKYQGTDVVARRIYFDIPKEFTHEMLDRANEAFKQLLGLKLCYKVVA